MRITTTPILSLYAGALSLALAGCSEFPEQPPIAETAIDPVPPLELLEAQSALASCQANYEGAVAATQENREALALISTQLRELSASLRSAGAAPKKAPKATPVAAVTEQPDKLLVGRLERIWVEDIQLALPARIDTGAETASLDARDIAIFERDGDTWVRFEIPHPKGGNPLPMERPLVREALVIQSNSDEPERRPVIELGIQLGPVRQLAEFTLSDRSHLDFQMLVGRNILQDVMLVDVSRANLVKPPQPAAKSENTAASSNSRGTQ